jgi:TonB dependent receptor/CarboxypepD_reg-like domain/TonB-dependent Receptor Plug Domain
MNFKLRYTIFTVICIVFLAGQSAAQKKPTAALTLDLHHVSYNDLLKEMEKQTGYRFFYDTADFDTTKLDINVQAQPLSAVLQSVFAGTGINFSVDRFQHVFIARGDAINTGLPGGFFDKVDTGRLAVGDTIRDYLEDVGKTAVATIENKLYLIGEKAYANLPGKVNLAGYALDAATGEPIVGASIYVENPRIGVSSDQYGYYSISLPRGRHVLNIQSIGMRDTRRLIMVYSDGKMNIELHTQVMTLKKVIVSAEKASNIKGTAMGVQKLDIKTIKQVPVVFGEADILRVITMLPGVQTVGESSTGLNVRGGAADQNLVLFNDATVYNASHFFGFFSAFNPEVVKDVELFKNSMPARYGGRLSSVLDINGRDGNKRDFAGSAGIGLLTSRLNLEGPIVKDKTSFIIGGRTTYADWLLQDLPAQYKNSKASFYDVNLTISHEINKKNNLYLTGYLSEDHFNLNNDTTYGYGNRNVNLRWKHIFSNKWNSVLSAGYDRYQYSITSTDNPINAYNLGFNINQLYFRANFNYYLSASHTIEFGLNTLRYKLHPGFYVPVGGKSLVTPDTLQTEQAQESALYLSDHYTVTNALSLDGGLRWSLYQYLGPSVVNDYAAGVPITVQTQTGTTPYRSGSVISHNGGPEFRFSARYVLTENFSLKAGYNTARQYIHMLSNTTAEAPTDVWKLSDPYIKPQYGDQISLGAYHNFKNNTIETSIEVYYKHIYDYLDYRPGAVLIMNPHIETDVLETHGKAYGVEVLIKKSTGKLNGWISYTYSRTLLQQNNPNEGPLINNGAWYPADYDKPNDAVVVANYRINHRFSISANANYSTGRPITLPIGVYYYAGSLRALYSDRNAYRIPDYFRTDFSMNIEGNHKVHQKTHNSWTVGVYNLTGRHNPYSVYYTSQNGAIDGYKLSIFGSAIPFVNFNIRF